MTHLFIVHFSEKVSADSLPAYPNDISTDDLFQLSPYTLLVRIPQGDALENPQVLGRAFGFDAKSPDPIVGAVFKLNGSYSGYYHSEMWDWLEEIRVEA